MQTYSQGDPYFAKHVCAHTPTNHQQGEMHQNANSACHCMLSVSDLLNSHFSRFFKF